MLLAIVLAVVALVAIFLVYVATRPTEFRYERSIVVAAPAERAFAQVNDFHAWAAWSPWEKLDPQLKRTFSGAPSGAGAAYAWQGNGKVGEGRMTIEKSVAASLISIRLEFLRPFAATNTAIFTFAPAAGGTKVTWAMEGRHAFVPKAMSVFCNMDKMIGGSFEAGLASIKSLAESGAAPAAAAS
jgi:hypothetical protein